MADAIRQIGGSEVTFYRWRQEFGGLKTDQVRRLKELELEKSRLRKVSLIETCKMNAVNPQPICAMCWRRLSPDIARSSRDYLRIVPTSAKVAHADTSRSI
jgi:hypothetical protein